ncbi:hypothetical protein KO566_05140 [Flavobacteriaceae bacterium XHP0103]|uniref:hypothetical protein n=1 Tax=Marixanthotalea marina TaxID=2844359 RepID=UPI002989ADFE|nr:hypothetical protein [Marixanthotalea marina]MBU3821436.1 hypothetical protein [Marixanthotalea marina]
MKKNLTKFYRLFLCAALVFAAFGCQTEELSDADNALLSAKKGGPKTPVFEECDFTANEVKLIAGQFTEVGKVTVEEDGDYYKITYLITDDGYCLTETHLSVVTDPMYFPISGGGNPKNGHFEYSGSHDCESSVEYMVPIADGPYIAAHAVVVCKSSSDEFNTNIELLPLTEQVCVTDKGDGNSYFDINIGGESFLAGNYDAWCIDLYKNLGNGECFNANIYPLYDENVDGAVDKPENLGAVNWIVNQDFISQGYTFGEIQWAIWELLELDNDTSYCCLGTWEESNGQEIVDLALENLDFEPACGELMGIAILPTEDDIQPVMISIPIPCDYDCEETAWGAANGEGCDFPGNNWATYFQYGAEEE